jgi:hypothetical protein
VVRVPSLGDGRLDQQGEDIVDLLADPVAEAVVVVVIVR